MEIRIGICKFVYVEKWCVSMTQFSFVCLHTSLLYYWQNIYHYCIYEDWLILLRAKLEQNLHDIEYVLYYAKKHILCHVNFAWRSLFYLLKHLAQNCCLASLFPQRIYFPSSKIFLKAKQYILWILFISRTILS